MLNGLKRSVVLQNAKIKLSYIFVFFLILVISIIACFPLQIEKQINSSIENRDKQITLPFSNGKVDATINLPFWAKNTLINVEVKRPLTLQITEIDFMDL